MQFQNNWGILLAEIRTRVFHMSGAPFFTVIGKYKVTAYKVKHSVRMWLFILITRHNKENTKAEALGDAFVENGKERM